MAVEKSSIPDKPSGGVRRDRLQALADRVGPSLDVARRGRWVAGFLILLFLSGVGLLSFQWVLQALVHSRAEIIVPDITGKTVLQALDALSAMNLSLSKDTVEFNESYPSGAILRQSPPAGLKVREGKVIRVTLSSGGQVVFIPELVSKPLPEAQNQMRMSGLVPGAVTDVYSQRFEAGWVVEQSPSPGAVAKRGQMVDLKVSKGLPPEGTILMPDFINHPVSEAMAWAKEKNLQTDVREENNPSALSGVVLKQSPSADIVVDLSDTIEFTVSRSTLTASDAEMVRYQVPAGTGRVQVRIVVRDEKEEREIFQDYKEAGSLIEVPVVLHGIARGRIFVNGVLVEERMLP